VAFTPAPFRPRILAALRDYDRSQCSRDLSAGITVGFVALPLAMAFGIASGVKPEQGLITAIVAGLLISLLGGSRVQIGGPAGAFVALLYAITDRYGVNNLLIATMMAGILLFLMGALRLGVLIRFVPVAIIIGFTNGIAVLIALQQVRDLLGLGIERMPADFIQQIKTIGEALPSANPWAIALALGSLAVLVLWPRLGAALMSQPATESPPTRAASVLSGLARSVLHHLPPSVLALVAGTLAVVWFELPVATIGSRFGQIPAQLPLPAIPSFAWESVRQLLAPAISIALLGAIESLLCARVADGMIEDRHDPNQELMAQGIANFVSPLFGGIAATGTIARTVTNIRSGGRTPVAGIVHAATLALLILAAAPLAAHVPLATLGAILLFVAWNMGEWHAFPELKRFHLPYRATMLTTFVLTVVLDITVAIEVGLVLSCCFFIWRISSLTLLEPSPGGSPERAVWSIQGALFFGSVDKLESLTHPDQVLPQTLILDLTRLLYLDMSGQEGLETLRRKVQKSGGRLILIAPSGVPLDLMRRSGFLDRLGPGAVLPSLQAFHAHAAEAAGGVREAP